MIIDERTKEFLDPAEGELFGRYSAIIRRLRAPDGCPWDRKQTLKSLRRFLLEESMEAIAAIDEYVDSGQVDAPETLLELIADELGDVTLVVMLLSSALRDAGGSSFSDILTMNGEKLVRRHPHVFGDLVVNDSETVVRNWNEIKRDQECRTDSPAAVPRGLPPLERAQEIQKKAASLGFDWDGIDPVREKLHEEIKELEAEILRRDDHPDRNSSRLEDELGDVLFSVVNVARHLKISPSLALAGTNERFLKRFRWIEESLAQEKKTFADSTLEDLDRRWELAKAADPGNGGSAKQTLS